MGETRNESQFCTMIFLSAFVARHAFCTLVFVVEEMLRRDTCCSGADLQEHPSWPNTNVTYWRGYVV